MLQMLGSNPLTQMMLQKGIPLSTLSQQTPSATNFQPDMQVPPYPSMPQLNPVAGVAQALQQPQQPQPAPMPQPQTSFQAPGLPNPAMVTSPKPPGQTKPKNPNKDQPILRVLAQTLQNLTKLAAGGQSNG